MTEQNRDTLLEHEYDGIREYDNPVPRWMHVIFWASAVFCFFYFVFYHGSTVSSSIADSYDVAVADDLTKRFAEIGELQPDEATILEYAKNDDWLKVGASVFKTHCVSCHSKDGSGLVGPNLTDDHWKNVRTLTDIARVITEGAANGAMPAWKTRLHPNEVVLVSSYVASLRGQNLPGPRGPEGEVIPAWPSNTGGSEK